MGTWQKNRCPRCGGKMFVDNDIDGWYEQCINCSARHELKAYAETTKPGAVKGVPNKLQR